MAEKDIIVKIPEEKMEVLEYFMQKKGGDIDGELKEYLDKIYEKVVPAPVRDFIGSKLQEAEEPVQGESTQGQTARETRRNERRSQQSESRRGQQNEPRRNRRNQGVQEDAEQSEEPVELQEDGQEEEEGMTMSM